MSENRHEPDEAREHETEILPTGTHTGAPAPDGAGTAPDATTDAGTRAVPDTQAIPAVDGTDPVPGPGSTTDQAADTPEPGAAELSAADLSAARAREQDASGTSPDAAGPAPVPGPQPAVPSAPPQGPRVGTIVWGLVVLAIGLGVLAAVAGARIDVSLAAILLLGGAGVALVAGSIVSSFRRRGEQ